MNVRQYTAFISYNNDKPNYGIIYGVWRPCAFVRQERKRTW